MRITLTADATSTKDEFLPFLGQVSDGFQVDSFLGALQLDRILHVVGVGPIDDSARRHLANDVLTSPT